MSDKFFYLQLKFTPKIGHTFTDEREVFVKVPKDLVQRKSQSVSESLKEVIALDLAKSAAIATFRTEAERVVNLYDEDPPIWHSNQPPIMNERPCDHKENGIRTWRVDVGIPMLANVGLNPSVLPVRDTSDPTELDLMAQSERA
jgi:hypothetical protein